MVLNANTIGSEAINKNESCAPCNSNFQPTAFLLVGQPPRIPQPFLPFKKTPGGSFLRPFSRKRCNFKLKAFWINRQTFLRSWALGNPHVMESRNWQAFTKSPKKSRETLDIPKEACNSLVDQCCWWWNHFEGVPPILVFFRNLGIASVGSPRMLVSCHLF